ncbi:hypothetical protein ACH5RR_008369 [Cinchona calisaya]|uniref:Uncharacterized protein n=1 Tax=Cinchona calisaya TaxID=153742 RepID=A0ABD3ABG2_9GENT
MDCVGCEKCRLREKLQVLGLGIALKILFSIDGHSDSNQPLQLQRNDMIALVNLLNRLSEFVKFVHEKDDVFERMVSDFVVSVNEVEALYELFKKLSRLIIGDGLIHKVRQMVIAILMESKMRLSDDLLEQIIDKESFIVRIAVGLHMILLAVRLLVPCGRCHPSSKGYGNHCFIEDVFLMVD